MPTLSTMVSQVLGDAGAKHAHGQAKEADHAGFEALLDVGNKAPAAEAPRRPAKRAAREEASAAAVDAPAPIEPRKETPERARAGEQVEAPRKAPPRSQAKKSAEEPRGARKAEPKQETKETPQAKAPAPEAQAAAPAQAVGPAAASEAAQAEDAAPVESAAQISARNLYQALVELRLLPLANEGNPLDSDSAAFSGPLGELFAQVSAQLKQLLEFMPKDGQGENPQAQALLDGFIARARALMQLSQPVAVSSDPSVAPRPLQLPISGAAAKDLLSDIKEALKPFLPLEVIYKDAASAPPQPGVAAKGESQDAGAEALPDVPASPGPSEKLLFRSREHPLSSLPQAPAPDAPAPQAQAKPVNDNALPAASVALPLTAADGDAQNTGGNSSGGQNNGGAPLAAVARADGAAKADGAQRMDFSQLVHKPAPAVSEQVMVHMRTAIATGDSDIHITLDPETLGKLDIKMSVSADGKTSMVLTADNKHTLELLQRDAGSLARALADAGLNTDGGSLNFNLRGGSQEGQGHAATTYQKAMPEEQEPTLAVTRSYVLDVDMAQGLDISI